MNRREFLQTSAVVALAANAAQAQENPNTSNTAKPLRVGAIGCGWYGKIDLLRLLQVAPVEVVALCDVDAQMLENAAKLVAEKQVSKNTPKTFKDYRAMLQAEKFDIVLVATPDHWHALPAIAAIEAGADVYLEKPISVDVREGAALVAAARKHNRVVQVNLQRRSTPHLVEARENIIKSGKLGKVGLVEIYSYYHMSGGGNAPDGNPPANLDFNLWTGPAPLRAFNPTMHPRGWRAFQEYGNGIVGDMCVHMLDMTRWMLDLGWPKRISSSGGIVMNKGKANIPDTQTATFEFDGLNVVWQHRTWGAPADPKYPWGATLYGDKGTLKASVFATDFSPMNEKEPSVHTDVKFEFDQFPEDRTERDLERHVTPALRAHWKDFLRARETRSRPVADIEQGHISSASCILANIAMQTGRTLEWDAAKQQIVGDAAANKYLQRPYRAPWKHPGAKI